MDLTRLRQLVETWRERQHYEARKADQNPYGQIKVAHANRSETTARCADELERELDAQITALAAITPPAPPDDLDQCRQILGWDMTHESGELPKPKERLGQVAFALYGAIQEGD